MKNSLETNTRYSKGYSSTKRHIALDKQQIINNGIKKCVEMRLLIHESDHRQVTFETKLVRTNNG